MLVDIIQKCVIMNATLSDLYGGASMTNNRDISIQPFGTSSILQHHYQTAGTPLSSGAGNPSTVGAELGTVRNTSNHNNSSFADNGPSASRLLRNATAECESVDNSANDNGAPVASLHKSAGVSQAESQPTAGRIGTAANSSQVSCGKVFQSPTFLVPQRSAAHRNAIQHDTT